MTLFLPSHLAYLRPSTLAGWSTPMVDRWAGEASAHGITGIVTKLSRIDDSLRGAAERHGLAVLGSFACYSDHADAVVADPPRPVGVDGDVLGPIEWYHGVTPGHREYDDALVSKFERDLETARVEAVFLDFLRWPGHWETESRDGGMPRASSFDADTLERFARRQDVPAIGHEQIQGQLGEWDDFRVETVRSLATRLARVAGTRNVGVGAFLVPLTHSARRRQYGQDAVSLADLVDVFAVMSYQQIAGIDIPETLALTDEVVALTGKPVVAMLQTTADPRFSGGWDWGQPFDPDDVRRRASQLEAARAEGRLSAICCFPAEAPLPDFTPISTTEGVHR